MSVGSGTPLVTISSNNIADGDPVQRARIAYEVSKKEYERMKALVKNKIVSDKGSLHRRTELRERPHQLRGPFEEPFGYRTKYHSSHRRLCEKVYW